jgi:hypothetical protein
MGFSAGAHDDAGCVDLSLVSMFFCFTMQFKEHPAGLKSLQRAMIE